MGLLGAVLYHRPARAGNGLRGGKYGNGGVWWVVHAIVGMCIWFTREVRKWLVYRTWGLSPKSQGKIPKINMGNPQYAPAGA